MSVGPTTFAASLAATSLNSARSSEAERVQHETSAKERQVEGDRKAENAAGIGTAEGDEAAGDRDADGRRLWERPPAGTAPADAEAIEASIRVKDPTGESGSLLDLTG
jgi:hypothetical protein